MRSAQVGEQAAPVTTLPSPKECESMLGSVRRFGGGLSDAEKIDLARCIECGAYSMALEIVHGAMPRVPHGARLVDELRSAALTLLENRLGSVHRRIAPGPVPAANLSSAHIVPLAGSQPTVMGLMQAVGGDSLRALEQIVRLVGQRCLVLGALREPR